MHPKSFSRTVRALLGLFLAGIFITANFPARALDSHGPKPNIIFILVDDMGYGDLGVLFQNARAKNGGKGTPAESTPNLDRFAEEGAQLRDHYCAAPVCAPSRASLLLGVTQGHANIRDNQFDKALENNHTLATVLKQAGYKTAAIGKWGLQGKGTNAATWPAYPTKRGFDYFFGYVRHKDGHEHYPKEGLYDGPKQVWDGTNEISTNLDKCYTADLWTAKAKQWIVEQETNHPSQPFFMYLAYDTPHAVQEYPAAAYPDGGGLKGGMQWLGKPHEMISTATGQPDTYVDPVYADATWDEGKAGGALVPWPNVNKRFATSVRRIDRALGDLTQLLKDLNIETNTLVVFSSDNGPCNESFLTNEPLKTTFFASYGPFDGIKRDCWEGGVRVPALVRWPGHIPSGQIITHPGGSYDWLPTFAEAAGLPVPARVDGVSFLPELTGNGKQRDRGYDYVEYFYKGKTPKYEEFAPQHRGRERAQMQAIRFGNFLGVRYNVQTQADPFEIYNVVKDPQETNNLATSMGSLQQQMHDRILQIRRPSAQAPRPYDDELVPAVSGVRAIGGVDWRAYEGEFPWLPNLETLQPVMQGTAANLDFSVRTRDNDMGILFFGYLKIPADGNYLFRLATDAGSLLRIHDATVIDADYGYIDSRTVDGSIKLKAGLHPFRFYYARGRKGWNSSYLSWQGPGIPFQVIPNNVFQREVSMPLEAMH